MGADALALIIDGKVYNPTLAGHLDLKVKFVIDLAQRVGVGWKRLEADAACPADLA